MTSTEQATRGVLFTQYLLPDGRTRQQWIERPAEIEAKAQRFIEAGGCFECEMLTTGEVSFTAVQEIDGVRQDVAIYICTNGPEVLDAVDQLICEVSP